MLLCAIIALCWHSWTKRISKSKNLKINWKSVIRRALQVKKAPDNMNSNLCRGVSSTPVLYQIHATSVVLETLSLSFAALLSRNVVHRLRLLLPSFHYNRLPPRWSARKRAATVHVRRLRAAITARFGPRPLIHNPCIITINRSNLVFDFNKFVIARSGR